MEYLVMECSLGYAVVLDSEGRFLKVPNLGYEVGQVLDEVVIMDSSARKRSIRTQFTRWAAMAACLCLMVLGGWGFWQAPVGTVRMQINPDVQMSVNRLDRVIGLEGLNADGETLIESYRSYGKAVKTVSDELADRAMAMGFLRDGGQITLTVESERENWKIAREEMLLLELDVHFDHRVKVVTVPANKSDKSDKSDKPDPPDSMTETIIVEPDKLLPEQKNDDDSDDRYEDTAPGKSRDNDDDQDDEDSDDDDSPGKDHDDDDDDRGSSNDENDDDDDDRGSASGENDDDDDDRSSSNDENDDDDRSSASGENDDDDDDWGSVNGEDDDDQDSDDD